MNGLWNDAIVAHLTALSRNSPGRTEGNHETHVRRVRIPADMDRKQVTSQHRARPPPCCHGYRYQRLGQCSSGWNNSPSLERPRTQREQGPVVQPCAGSSFQPPSSYSSVRIILSTRCLHFYHEDGDNRFLRNVGNDVQVTVMGTSHYFIIMSWGGGETESTWYVGH
jgi:hypothetical protein